MASLYPTTAPVNTPPGIYALPRRPRNEINDGTPVYDGQAQGQRIERKPRVSAPFVKFPTSVLKDKSLSAWARLLYPLLIDYRTERGIFPGRDRLADDLGVSIPTVDRALTELCSAGLLTKMRQGRGHTNRYTIVDNPSPVSGQGAHDSSPVMTHDDDLSPVMSQIVYESSPVMSPESSPVMTPLKEVEQDLEEQETVKTPLPPKGATRPPKQPEEESGVDPRFDEWYEVWPKKRARQDAERAWAKLNPDGHLFDALMERARLFRLHTPPHKLTFIPNAATFLNGKRWTDDPPGPDESVIARSSPTNNVDRSLANARRAIEFLNGRSQPGAAIDVIGMETT